MLVFVLIEFEFSKLLALFCNPINIGYEKNTKREGLE